MQFRVPQFIDIEDKVFGPLSFKQFIYLVGGGGIAYIIYSYLGLAWGFLFIIFFGGLGAALAFWKPHQRPFIDFFKAFISYYSKKRMYVWQRPENKLGQTEKDLPMYIKKENQRGLTEGKLRELAWSLDVLDSHENK